MSTPPFVPPPQYPPTPTPYPYPTFTCPFCHSTYPPRITQKISTGGWVLFVVLLLFCWPLFWIGLLIKEDVRTCSSCGMKLG